MTPIITLRPATPADTPTIVALNAAVVAVTSPMDDGRFCAMLASGARCTVVEADGQVIGFVLTMAHDVAYDNGNFAWFAARLDRFVYIDRIVIGAGARGLGLGRTLYDHLVQAARAAGQPVLAAEMDLVPANPASIAFHRAYGFVETGQRTLDSGKIVSMQIKAL